MKASYTTRQFSEHLSTSFTHHSALFPLCAYTQRRISQLLVIWNEMNKVTKAVYIPSFLPGVLANCRITAINTDLEGIIFYHCLVIGIF